MSGEYQNLLQHMRSYGFQHFEGAQEHQFLSAFLQKLNALLESDEKSELLKNVNVLLEIALLVKTQFLWKNANEQLKQYATARAFIEIFTKSADSSRLIRKSVKAFDEKAEDSKESEKYEAKKSSLTPIVHKPVTQVIKTDISVQGIKPRVQCVGNNLSLGSEFESPRSHRRSIPPGFEFESPGSEKRSMPAGFEFESPGSHTRSIPPGFEPMDSSASSEMQATSRSSVMQGVSPKASFPGIQDAASSGVAFRPVQGLRTMVMPAYEGQPFLLEGGTEFIPEVIPLCPAVPLVQNIIVCPSPQRFHSVDPLLFSYPAAVPNLAEPQIWGTQGIIYKKV